MLALISQGEIICTENSRILRELNNLNIVGLIKSALLQFAGVPTVMGKIVFVCKDVGSNISDLKIICKT